MKSKVLISIKPHFVNKIFAHEKKFEFRKLIFNPIDVEKVYIYSSSPIKAIVGSFQIGEIISGHPKDIWINCKMSAGISEDDYFKYFQGKTIAHAIAITNLCIFRMPFRPYDHLKDFHPPQSYRYLDKKLIKFLSGKEDS